MESTKVSDGTTRTPSSVQVHDGVSTREAHYVYVHDGVAPRLVYIRYFLMSLGDSGDVSGSCSTSTTSDCAATTGSVTVSVTNGRAPFTYAWSYVSGATATANSATSATTTFTRSAAGSPGGTQYVGVYRCTVTDATGRTATNDVTVTTTHTSTFTPLLASKSGNASGSCSYVSPTTNCTATTNSVTVTASGGVGPYSYAWAYVSGDTATVNSGTSATTTFSRTQSGVIGGTSYSGTYRCTVTDSLMATATVDVTVGTTHSDTFVAPALGISKSGDASGACNYNSPSTDCTATTNSVTITATGGTPPYVSYVWSYQSGTTATVNSPGAATTSFSRTGNGSLGGSAYSGVYRCTVTDSAAAVISVDVTVGTTHTQNPDPLSASASTGTVSGSCSYATPTANCSATTGSVTITPSGGVGPYTYAWSNVSGSTASVNSPTSATTTFTRSASGTNGGQLYSGAYRCTVTDSQARVTSVDVTVNTTHTNTYVTMSAGISTGYTWGQCSVNNGNGCSVTSSGITVTPSGGTAPYTYSWAHISGEGATINSASSATTSFTRGRAGSPAGLSYAGAFRCTVTDAIGATATADVTFESQHIDSYVVMSVGKSTDCYGSCSYTAGGSCAAGTNWVDITVSGGLAPFTYSWAYYSGTAATISNPSGSSVWFSRDAAGTQTLGGWYSCTVYDATGRWGSVVVYVQTTHTLSYTPMSLGKSDDAYGNYWCESNPPVTNCPFSANVATNSVTVSVSGGLPGYSYSWSQVSGDASIAYFPTSASTSFRMDAVERNAYNSATWRCTVTDSTNNTAYIDVSVNADYSWSEGGIIN